MFAAFRRLSKSKIGTSIMVLFLVGILASFAMADMNSLNLGGMSSGTLVSTGGEKITDRDVSKTFDQILSQRRQQNPNLTSASMAGEFDAILEQMINERLLTAFANKHGLIVSKRLIDAQLAKIPGARGLDGKVTAQSYAQWLSTQRMDDAFVRRAIAGDLLRQTLLLPVAASPRVSVGMAMPYASALLEQRQGEVALVATDAFKAGLAPTPGDIQSFYQQNRARYMVPEGRVLRLATITADSAPVAAPTEQEIAAYYKANAATYGGGEKRVISQAVVPDQKVAAAIAQRLKAGATFVAAAAPAGLSAEDISVGPQSESEFAGLAGTDIARKVFTAASGSMIGPVKSDLGWHVIKVDAIQSSGGKSLDAVRPEIIAKLTADKRKEAVADVVAKVEDMIADGSSLPEAAAAAKLQLVDTPLIAADGTSRTDPSYRVDPKLAPAIKSGFDLAEGDDPVVEELADGSGYVVVGVGRTVPAAPAPLDQIRERVIADWTQKKAASLARAAAASIASKVAAGQSMADAVKAVGKGATGPRPLVARRIDLARANENAAAPLRMLFSLAPGKSRLVADPQERAFFIVKNDKVIPGSAATQPALVTQTQRGFQQSVSDELAQQFIGALRKSIGVKRNEKAIQEAKARLTQVAN
jgi:peptidyl-prolyl cis-trans isomerase D